MSQATRSQGVVLFGPLQASLASLTGLRAAGLAALFGMFAALAFAPFNATISLVLSFVGLIWMLDGARAHRKWGRSVFARGWAFGFGFFLVSLHWTASPFLVEPEKHAIFLWMPLLLLPGGMALIWGGALAMAGAFWSASPSRVFVFSMFFAMAEWLRGTLFGGFPWNLAGTSWIAGGAMSQGASLGGVYWLTLITVFVCSAPAGLVDTRPTRSFVGRFVPIACAVIVLASLWSWGTQRLSAETTYTSTNVVLMDVGVPQSEKFVDGAPNPDVFRRYLAFLRDVPARNDDIIIWPEGATGGYTLEARQLEPIAAYLNERKLIAGTVRFSRADGTPTWHNSLAIVSADSALDGAAGIYDKHRLVPVGELPVARIIPFGRAFSSILPGAIQRLATAGFEPGPGPAIVYSDGLPPFIPMICYEALYPNIARDAQAAAGERAEWLVVVSNDAWFGAFVGPAQHYIQNRYRAIETGLPMARVAARGSTAMVDGNGREVFRASGLREDLPNWQGRIGRTALPEPVAIPIFQTRLGQALFPASLALFAVFAFLAWRR